VLGDRNVRGRPTAGPQSVNHSARAAASVGQLRGPVHPSHAPSTSRSTWLLSAATSRSVGCRSNTTARLRRPALTEEQSLFAVPRAAPLARWLAPAVRVLHAARSIRGTGNIQDAFTGGGAYSWSEHLTTGLTCRSGRSRALLLPRPASPRKVSRQVAFPSRPAG
jgi:hypothetical protein